MFTDGIAIYFLLFFQDDCVSHSKMSAKSDGMEMQNYYEFYSKYVKSLEETTGANMDRYVLDASFPNP